MREASKCEGVEKSETRWAHLDSVHGRDKCGAPPGPMAKGRRGQPALRQTELFFFGISSPSGWIDTALVRARFRDTAEVNTHLDNGGQPLSWRGSFKLNHLFREDFIVIHAAVLTDQTKCRQRSPTRTTAGIMARLATVTPQSASNKHNHRRQPPCHRLPSTRSRCSGTSFSGEHGYRREIVKWLVVGVLPSARGAEVLLHCNNTGRCVGATDRMDQYRHLVASSAGVARPWRQRASLEHQSGRSLQLLSNGPGPARRRMSPISSTRRIRIISIASPVRPLRSAAWKSTAPYSRGGRARSPTRTISGRVVLTPS